MRLDIHITEIYPDITRSQAKRLVEDGHVKVDGKIVSKPSQNLKGGEELVVDVPPPTGIDVIPQNIKLEILYEDKDLVVVNKPSDMVVHPGAGNKEGTLVNALLYHCKDLSGIGGELRPGIVHRLDKGTSGVMVVAKNDLAHANLSDQFKNRTIEKKYYAIVYGKVPKDEGTISIAIGRHPTDRKKMSTKTKHGRASTTHFKVLKRFGTELTFVDIKLATGRTHQIRVHFSHLGHPLIGDEVYGGMKAIKRLKDKKLIEIVKPFSRPALHAYKLAFTHPKTGKRMEFSAPIPKDMNELLESFNELYKI